MRKAASLAVAAANLRFDKPYSYLMTPEIEKAARVGMRVRIPFGKGNRRTEGVIIGFSDVEDTRGYKYIAELANEESAVDEDMLRLAFWLRKRCYCPLYDVLRAMVPASVSAEEKTVIYASLAIPRAEAEERLSANKRMGEKKKAVVRLLYSGKKAVGEIEGITGAKRTALKELEKDGYIAFSEERSVPCGGVYERPPIRDQVLAPAQEEVYRELQKMAFSGKACCALLHGVTGSGKTHVYIKLITDVLRAGKTAILLVPEIALTPQMIERFYNIFGERVACLHSGLSDGERRREWLRVKRKEADVVVGTRSAVFAPVKQENLGIIIIDEEHEYSYKSESSPRYHARDVAKYRSARANILLLLGSATPSVESEYLSSTGAICKLELRERYNNATLASVEIIDRKGDLRNGNDNAIGSVLASYLRENVSRCEQSILFINRRGRNRRMVCTACGASVECPHCSSAMSYHSAGNKLICHICGHAENPPLLCPSCGGAHLMLDKAGTQKIEEEIAALVPGATAIRMDTDTTGSRNSHAAILERFRKEKIDILVGTQMITKGLDFPNVTLVGVLDADMTLFANDFRAGERTFSLLTQVVGRAGRGEKKGRAVIQTYCPENSVLLAAARQDYDAFYQEEIRLRRALLLPPFLNILAFQISGMNESDTARGAHRFAELIAGQVIGKEDKLLGPVPCAVYKANNRFRWSLTVKTENLAPLREKTEAAMCAFLAERENKDLLLTADENPYE